MHDNVYGRVARLQERHAGLVVGIFLVLTVAMVPGMAQVETIVALENMMPAAAAPVAGFQELRDAGIGKDSIAVMVAAGHEDGGVMAVTAPAAQDYIDGLGERLQAVDGITTVYTPADDPSLIDANRDTAVVIGYTYHGDDGAAMERVFADVRAETVVDRPDGLRTQVSGVPAVQQQLSDMVERDKTVTTIIALLLVFVITLGLFRGSVSAAAMPMLVVGLSVVWLYGTMGYLGLPLSTLAGAVAALVIGIGIDYAIHIMNTYRFHRQDSGIDDALAAAVGETGSAIIATSVTTISAFLAFLVGQMPEMYRFGLTMALGIGYALLFSFLFLPAVFVLEERLMDRIHDSMQWRVSDR